MWLNAYLCGWLLTAVGAVIFASAFPEIRVAPPLTRAAVALLAGGLWPVVLLGLAEIAFITWFARRLKTTAAQTATDESDGTKALIVSR